MARLEAVLATYRETLTDERRALFDHYRLVDAAIKVVGIGSVGRRCWIGLIMSAATTRCSCSSRRHVRRRWSPMPGPASIRITGSALLSASG